MLQRAAEHSTASEGCSAILGAKDRAASTPFSSVGNGSGPSFARIAFTYVPSAPHRLQIRRSVRCYYCRQAVATASQPPSGGPKFEALRLMPSFDPVSPL